METYQAPGIVLGTNLETLLEHYIDLELFLVLDIVLGMLLALGMHLAQGLDLDKAILDQAFGLCLSYSCLGTSAPLFV